MQNGLKKIRSDTSGGVAIEFAILGALFISLVLGVMEYARIMWIQQALQDVAFDTARCMTVDTLKCNDLNAVVEEAIVIGQEVGIDLSDAQLTPTSNEICHNYEANIVTITMPLPLTHPHAG